MNPAEAVVLTRYVKALCPQQKIDKYTPDAWHDLLGHLPLDEARTAAATVAARQPFVSPSEIIGEIRARHDGLARDFQGPGLPAEIPDADPDDVSGYLAAIRTQRTRAAHGHPTARRPVAELVAAVGRDIPPEVITLRRPGPLGVECPNCHAAVGRSCKGPYRGSPRAPHAARRAAVKAVR